jgi:hypothetical protein
MNSYYNDDLLQRCLILWIMALLVTYCNNNNLVAGSIIVMLHNCQLVRVCALDPSANVLGLWVCE